MQSVRHIQTMRGGLKIGLARYSRRAIPLLFSCNFMRKAQPLRRAGNIQLGEQPPGIPQLRLGCSSFPTSTPKPKTYVWWGDDFDFLRDETYLIEAHTTLSNVRLGDTATYYQRLIRERRKLFNELKHEQASMFSCISRTMSSSRRAYGRRDDSKNS